MNVLQNITALFRSPDAAVLAAQAVQGADLAARQGAATLRRDAEHDRARVRAGEPSAASATVAGRREREAREGRGGSQGRGRGRGAGEAPPAHGRRRIDITA